MQDQNFFTKKGLNRLIGILVIGLLITVGALLHVLFSNDISNLSIEILAAVVGVVLVIVSVALTIHFQVEAEKDREFQVELFKTKVGAYQDFISKVIASDDDDCIKDSEIEGIRNSAAILTLYASQELVKKIGEFLARLRAERKILLESQNGDDSGTFRGVVTQMRHDLDVADNGDSKNSKDPKDNFKEHVKKIIAKPERRNQT